MDIGRIVAARFLSRAGSEAAFFIGVWGKAAYDFDATPGQLAIVMLGMSVAMMLGSIIAGVLVDRFGPRAVLIGGEIFFVPATVAIIFAPNITWLAGLVAIWSLFGAPVMTAGASFAPYLTRDDERLKRLNALIEGAGSAAFVVGPAAGAIIARYSHPDWVFVLDAVTSLIAAILVWRLRLERPKRERSQGPKSSLGELRAGLAAAYGNRGLRYYVLAGTVVWMSFGAFGALEPLFYRDVLKTSIDTLGWMNTLFGLAMLFGAWLLPRLPRTILSAGGLAIMVALMGTGALLYVGSADLRVVALGSLAWGTIIGVTEPLMRTLMHRDTPRELVGRVMGTAMVHRHAGELLPLAFAPAAAAAFGVQPTLIAGGLIATTIALLSIPEARGIDRWIASRGTPAIERIESLTTADEPISPNP